jgi:hypothetical protein
MARNKLGEQVKRPIDKNLGEQVKRPIDKKSLGLSRGCVFFARLL